MKSITGFTLVELMIATLVTTTGIVGSLAIQASAKKYTFDALQRSQATALAHDMIERIRRNKSQIASYGGMDFGQRVYTSVTECYTNASGTPYSCSPLELATYDQFQWNAALKGDAVTRQSGGETKSVGGLLNPTGCIVITSINGADGNSLTDAGRVDITISWAGRSELKDANESATIKNCGGSAEDTTRRQVNISALVY
jgi:type IV pilus assembly protein PilV